MLGHCIKIVLNDTSSEPTVRQFSKCCVLIHMDISEEKVLQDESHEENSSSTNESVGSDYST
jgi:hypothetical protein